MSQHAIAVTSGPLWRRRSILVVTLVALLAAGTGLAVGLLVSSDSTVSERTVAAPVEVTAAPADACPADRAADGSTLLGLFLAPDVMPRVVTLSADAQALVGLGVVAASQSAADVPAQPGTAAVVGLLTRLDPADREVALGILTPEVRDVVDTVASVAPLSVTCP